MYKLDDYIYYDGWNNTWVRFAFGRWQVITTVQERGPGNVTIEHGDYHNEHVACIAAKRLPCFRPN